MLCSHDGEGLDDDWPLSLRPPAVGPDVRRAILPVPLGHFLVPLGPIVSLDIRQGGAGDPHPQTHQLCPAQIKQVEHIPVKRRGWGQSGFIII